MRWGGSIESSILKPQKVTMWLWSYRIYFCPIGSTIHFPLQLTHESKTFWKSFAVKGTLCTFGSCINGSFFFFFHRKVTCKGKDELQTKSLEKWYWKTLRTHNKNIGWNPININRWNNKLLLTEKKIKMLSCTLSWSYLHRTYFSRSSSRIHQGLPCPQVKHPLKEMLVCAQNK